MKMKKMLAIALVAVMALGMTACSGGSDNKPAADNKQTNNTTATTSASANPLVDDYGFQTADTTKPILNDKGASELSFTIYSSKNASAKDYNDMKIMNDLYAQTNVQVNWENVSESVYAQQKNLIFGNAENRPDAIYHAGMGAGEIIKYAKRKVLVPISDYLDYMPNFAAYLEANPIVMLSITGTRGSGIPLTMVLVLALYIGKEILAGVTSIDNISQLTHIIGGVCGLVLGLSYRHGR